jgi:putative SOS response-associated peptidase YedK
MRVLVVVCRIRSHLIILNRKSAPLTSGRRAINPSLTASNDYNPGANMRNTNVRIYPSYNIAPSQDVPVIVQDNGKNELKPMKWGLVP